MSMFDRFFKEEQKPAAAIGGDAPATTKLKLNFKRLPKKMVQAIADQTTGETIIREEESAPQTKRSRLMGDFNDAARGMTDRGSEARALTGEPMRPERIQMPRPAMPRAPSFNL